MRRLARVDRIDPPRFFPLVGQARLHHVHWKCIVRCDEIKEAEEPFAGTVRKAVTHVVYIDRDHLHLVAHVNKTRGHDGPKAP